MGRDQHKRHNRDTIRYLSLLLLCSFIYLRIFLFSVTVGYSHDQSFEANAVMLSFNSLVTR